MKKFAAIFFLLLFSFNWFGYRLMYDYLQQKTNENLEALLDINSYDDSKLIELKIPVNLPYQNNWASFERYDGEIEVDGIIYKYVKRKLSDDTLYLMCIPNTKKMHLETAKNDFFKISNGLAKKTNNSKPVFKYLQTLYNESSFGLCINLPIAYQKIIWVPLKAKHLLFASHLSPEQPPDPSRLSISI